MKFRILILWCLALSFQSAMGSEYQVTVYGKLIELNGKGVSGKSILISSPENQRKYIVAEKAETVENGEFKWPVFIPDTISSGTIVLTFENCNGKSIAAEYRFSKEKPNVEARLIYCDKIVINDCKLEIAVKKLNDTMGLAIAVAKGKGPITFKWNTGETSDSIRFSLLKDIRLCVTTKDSVGCVNEKCHSQEAPCESAVIVRRINDSVAVAVVIAKGKKPFRHSWTDGQTGDTARFNPLNKIKMCVTTVDSIGCTSEACVNFIPAVCVATIENVRNVLFGYLKNDIPKSYKWSNGSEKPFIDIKDTGTYCVTIKGLGGCEATTCYRVKAVDSSKCEAEIVLDSLGSISQDAVSGVKLTIKADYKLNSIKWSTGETTPSIIVRKSGEYCVSTSDNEKCKSYVCKKVEVKETLCTLILKQEKLPSSTNAANNKVKLSFDFSSTAKIIVWSTKDTTRTIIVEKSGEYCVTVSDNVNCKQVACIKVEIPQTPIPPVPGDCDASISIRPVSATEVKLVARVAGKSPLTFKWSTGSTDQSISVKSSGKYCLDLTDGSGCKSQACVNIEIDGTGVGVISPNGQKTNLQIIKQDQPTSIKLGTFPNPTSDKINYELTSPISGQATLTLINLYGKKVWQKSIEVDFGTAFGSIEVQGFTPGVYQLMYQQNGYMKTNKIIIGK